MSKLNYIKKQSKQKKVKRQKNEKRKQRKSERRQNKKTPKQAKQQITVPSIFGPSIDFVVVSPAVQALARQRRKTCRLRRWVVGM